MQIVDIFFNNLRINCAYFQAYHSQISKADDHLSSFALLPIRTQTRGPAPISNGEDIIDETIYYFKANIFFRTYEIKVMQHFRVRVIGLIFHHKIENSFVFSEWHRSFTNLHHIIHYGMLEKTSKMFEQSSSTARLVLVGNCTL